MSKLVNANAKTRTEAKLSGMLIKHLPISNFSKATGSKLIRDLLPPPPSLLFEIIVMAKLKPIDPEREAKKLAKAEKKAKRSETDGVHKSKSDKKDKKEKTIAAAAEDTEVTTKLLNAIEDTKPGSIAIKEENGDLKVKVKTAPLLGALVPFANPLADEKVGKKVLKSVKKGKKLPLFVLQPVGRY